MPESGQPPIRVYKEHDMWHVDYGEGVTQDHASREEAEAAADEAAQSPEAGPVEPITSEGEGDRYGVRSKTVGDRGCVPPSSALRRREARPRRADHSALGDCVAGSRSRLIPVLTLA